MNIALLAGDFKWVGRRLRVNCISLGFRTYPWGMSTLSDGGTFHPDHMQVEQRTSVLAIVALVLSLICFIPGLGAMGALLGVVALIFISKSAGRLVGSGFAIAGIIIGLIVTVIWVAILVGGSSAAAVFAKAFVKPSETTMMAIENGDYATARAQFTSTTAAQLTDADFDAFKKEYQSSLGSFKSAPSGFWQYITMFGGMGPGTQNKMNQLNGRQDTVPIPMTFEKGTGIMFVVIDPKGGSGSTVGQAGMIPIINFQIHANDKTITLIDPNARALPGDTQPADGTGEAPKDAPADESGDPKPEPK